MRGRLRITRIASERSRAQAFNPRTRAEFPFVNRARASRGGPVQVPYRALEGRARLRCGAYGVVARVRFDRLGPFGRGRDPFRVDLLALRVEGARRPVDRSGAISLGGSRRAESAGTRSRNLLPRPRLPSNLIVAPWTFTVSRADRRAR